MSSNVNKTYHFPKSYLDIITRCFTSIKKKYTKQTALECKIKFSKSLFVFMSLLNTFTKAQLYS